MNVCNVYKFCTFTTVETYFFVPEPLWNSDNQKLSNFTIDFLYRSVISPFAMKSFLLPFSSHWSTQNIVFSDSGHSSNFRNQAPLFTELCFLQGTDNFLCLEKVWTYLLLRKSSLSKGWVVLQPIRWCCVDCMIHHEKTTNEETNHHNTKRQ